MSGADLREAGLLGEEPIARMDRVATADERGRDHCWLVQVALPCFRRPDADRLVRQSHRQRLPIGLAVGDHGGHPQVAAGTQDAHRDLPAVGDQDLVEHQADTFARAPISASTASSRLAGSATLRVRA